MCELCVWGGGGGPMSHVNLKKYIYIKKEANVANFPTCRMSIGCLFQIIIRVAPVLPDKVYSI